MSDPTIIRINPDKATDLDFEVSVQTNCADDKPCVRFSVELEQDKRWLSLVCTKDEETKKWNVTIPALKSIVDRPSYPFVLEVIVEDYYFVPAKGNLQPLMTPTADIGNSGKPTVTATFGAEEKKEEPSKEKDEKEEKIEEGMPFAGGNAYGGMVGPTNTLLKPERPIKGRHVEKPEKKDRNINDVLDTKVVPGDQGMTADTQAQPDGKGPFDAREIASRVVKDRIKTKKPTGKGYLFNRHGDKAVVEGLEPKDIKKIQDDKAKKVKDILKD